MEKAKKLLLALLVKRGHPKKGKKEKKRKEKNFQQKVKKGH